ncbi:MAG: HAD family hydrolase [Chloroflexi bacterium]|nr:HAD family hydrolase [Chloroflexota bacterium]MYC48286.1 HAD family hydrolase [Chloroflexota bacterium]
MIDTIVFDFDGVILDTERPNFESWEEVFASHGVELDLGHWSRHIVGTADESNVFGHLEQLTGRRVDREAVESARRVRYLRRVNSQAPMPGVLDRLREAKALGLNLGVASSSSRGWVEGHLQRLGILEFFGAIWTRDDVANAKPDPEIYRSVTAALGSLPQQALAVEDSAHGVNAAKGAGLYCVAVPNSITRHLPLRNADLRIDSLTEISFEGLSEELGLK